MMALVMLSSNTLVSRSSKEWSAFNPETYSLTDAGDRCLWEKHQVTKILKSDLETGQDVALSMLVMQVDNRFLADEYFFHVALDSEADISAEAETNIS